MFQPLNLFVAERTGHSALSELLFRGEFFGVVGLEGPGFHHLTAQKKDAVFVIPAHARGRGFSCQIHDCAAVGSFVDQITDEDQVIAIFDGEGDFV